MYEWASIYHLGSLSKEVTDGDDADEETTTTRIDVKEYSDPLPTDSTVAPNGENLSMNDHSLVVDVPTYITTHLS